MKPGYLTVYLSLTLAIMMSLIFAIIEGARYSAMRLQVETVTDMGLDSVFSEFNRELLNQYDLFFIDTSYGAAKGSVANTGDHLQDYMSYNFDPKKEEALTFFYKDFMDVNIMNVDIQEAAFATDDQGLVFKRQAIDYMKDKYMVMYFDVLKDQMNTVTSNGWNDGDIMDDLRQAVDEVEEAREEIEENGDDSLLEEYTDLILDIRGNGILNYVVPDISGISNQSVNLSNYVSNRNLNRGCGLTEDVEAPDGVIDELIFGEYIMEKYGCFTDLKADSLLKYQIEYILMGKKSDTENLKDVVTLLLNLRAFANLAYLYTDSVKQNEVEVIAGVIAAAILLPELVDVIALIINIVWAYAEAMVDMRTLLSGGKVPLWKTGGSWNLSLTGLSSFAFKKGSSETGVSYEEYLRIFVGLMDRQKKVMRSMDVAEMDIRQTEGNAHFRLDQCIDYLYVNLALSSGFGYNFLVHKRYRYE